MKASCFIPFVLTALVAAKTVHAGDADILFILDQSGSMGLSFVHINTAKSPPDTLFYTDNNSCKLASTTYAPRAVGQAPGANVSTNPVTVQTYVGPRTAWNIIDTTGCNDFSGDPKKARASVTSQGIDLITTLSQNSTIGYLPFANNIQTSARSQRPLTLTSTNISVIKSKIIIDSADGTNYVRPLDSSKKWLNAPLSLGKNSKRAIIFISDGSPTPADSNGLLKSSNGSYLYVDTGSATRISIYSIFLRDRATSDTAILKQLSDITRPSGITSGSNFYHVPSSRPDSFSSTMNIIIHKILDGPTPIAPQKNSPRILKNPDETKRHFDMRGRKSQILGAKENAKVPTVDFKETIEE